MPTQLLKSHHADRTHLYLLCKSWNSEARLVWSVCSHTKSCNDGMKWWCQTKVTDGRSNNTWIQRIMFEGICAAQDRNETGQHNTTSAVTTLTRNITGVMTTISAVTRTIITSRINHNEHDRYIGKIKVITGFKHSNEDNSTNTTSKHWSTQARLQVSS
jgi:hypothetical protein